MAVLRVEMKINPDELDDDQLIKYCRDLLLIEKTRSEVLHNTMVNSFLEAWNRINGKKSKRK
jgi:hypothetical protein